MAKHNYGGVYANMDFPPYEYVPYPRHIPTTDGKYEVANSEAEEAAIKAKLKKDHDNLPALDPYFTSDPEKEILFARAKELGVPFNPKWSKAKLKNVIDTAEMEIDNLPPDSGFGDKAPAFFTRDLMTPTLTDTFDKLVETPNIPDDREALVAKAKSMGINPVGIHLWGIPRLKATIAEHEQANNNDE